MLNKISKSFFVFVVVSVLIMASLPSSVSAEDLEKDNYIVHTNNLSSVFGAGDSVFVNSTGTSEVVPLYVRDGSSGALQNPFFQTTGTKAGVTVECQPTWVLDTKVFNGSKQYIFDFYICVIKNGVNAYLNLKNFRFFFGNYNNKYYEPVEYFNTTGSTTMGIAHFRFVVDGQILNSSFDICRFEFSGVNSQYLYFGLPKEEPYTIFKVKEYTEADQIGDIGSDISQPSFGGANDSLGTTADDLKSFDEEYKIDMEQTSADLESGMSTLNGTDMQKASIQVKNWIERFANENTDYIGFLIGGLTLAVCFWVIGRKGWEK